jgi:protein-tyrosine phosphatase
MKANLHWIERPGSGRLAILARPRGGDWLEDEVLSWKNAGVKVLVSALTPEEILELDLEKEKSLCQTHAIDAISFPVKDREVTSTRELAQTLEQALLEGKSVVIHCRQGIGRSSLLAACVLVLEGMDSEAAFHSISRARGCPVPDTTEQRQWVARFARDSPKTVPSFADFG